MTAEQRLRAQATFLDAYEHTANILRAAEQAEVSRQLVYYWLEHDERFLLAYNLADKAANAHIEAEIRRRAIEGIEEPVISNGMITYEWEPDIDEATGEQKRDGKGKLMYTRGKMVTTRKYSDVLLMFLAKKRMPEYRDKQPDVTVNNNLSGVEIYKVRIPDNGRDSN